jgi:hypothetical protein
METFGVEPDGLAFSHRVHVGDEGLECYMCHINWEEDDDPGMPTAAACQLCHDPEDEDAPPIAELFDGEVYKATRASALGDEITYSHLFHVTDEEGCTACHAEVIQSDRVEPWMAVTMDDCVACHTRVEARTDCTVCHAEIDVTLRPWTHDATWEQFHGQSVRNRSNATVDRCELCHKESSCVECHQENAPASHTNFWRRRGHGLTASLDRATCMACHTPDFCNRCHENAVPVSHRGQWGSPRNTHCLSCHLGGGDQSCSLCHTEITSHDTAPPLPPGHNPMSDCRECHQLLTHADNGGSCLACHH